MRGARNCPSLADYKSALRQNAILRYFGYGCAAPSVSGISWLLNSPFEGWLGERWRRPWPGVVIRSYACGVPLTGPAFPQGPDEFGSRGFLILIRRQGGRMRQTVGGAAGYTRPFNMPW